MSTIEIIVGNIGTVLTTVDTKEASDIYRHYCDASDRGTGRMAREDVTMTVDGEPAMEHVGYDSRLKAMDDGAFMPSDITSKVAWYEVDSVDGTDWIPVDIVGDLPGLPNVGDIVSFEYDAKLTSETEQTNIRDALADYISADVGRINAVERIEGYGACLSAPGYVDCTDTVVFETEHDAIVYLVDTYEDPDKEVDQTD